MSSAYHWEAVTSFMRTVMTGFSQTKVGKSFYLAGGTALAIGIGIQNFIEGLVVAVPVYRTRKRIMEAFLIASFTCIVEPIGGFLGISVVSLATSLTPYGLAFAAGAMLFVTSEEVIPETHSRGYAREATIGLIMGFIVMMFLESLFVV